jgi:hypothetical protein
VSPHGPGAPDPAVADPCPEAADAKALIADLQADRQARQDAVDADLSRRKPYLDMRQHRSLPFLVVPYEEGDEGDRPLPDRPDAPSPLRSAAVDVVTPAGERVFAFDYGTTYELRCRVRNEGDMDVPPTRVEFFVRHYRPYVTFDTGPDDRVHVEPAGNQLVTGTTSLAPGTTLDVRTLRGSPDPFDGTEMGRYRATVADDRSFSFAGYFSRYAVGQDDIYVHLRYADTGTSVPLAFESNPPDYRSRMNWDLSVPLDAVLSDGEVRDGHPDDASPPPYDPPVYAGVDRVRAPAGREGTASVSYTTPPAPSPGSADRKLYFNVRSSVHARVYSLAPLDAPNDWGVLDHRLQRHVGRTERAWAPPPEVSK